MTCPWCSKQESSPEATPRGCCLLAARKVSDEAQAQGQGQAHVVWSSATRSHLTALLIHLRSFHDVFNYELCADRQRNLHIVVESKLFHDNDDVGDDDSDGDDNVNVNSDDAADTKNKIRKRSRSPSRSSTSSRSPGTSSRASGCQDLLHGDPLPPELAQQGPPPFFSCSGRGSLARERFAIQNIDCIPIAQGLQLPLAVQTEWNASYLKSCKRQKMCRPRPRDGTGEEFIGNVITRGSNGEDDGRSSTATSNCDSGPDGEIDSAYWDAGPEEGSTIVKHRGDDNDYRSVVESDDQLGVSNREFFTIAGQCAKPYGEFHNVDTVNNNLWMTEHTNRVISEYADVNLNEKVFMCKWNDHIAACPVYADMWMARVCELFARRHSHFLLRHNLRHVFLLHLITLWDHSLLTLDNVETCISIVDTVHAASSEVL